MDVHRWAVLPGESVIWEGRPTRFLWMSRADLPLMLLATANAAAVTGFFLVVGPHDLAGTVFVMLLVGVAVLGLCGQPLWRAVRLRRARYALSTHRIFVLDGLLIKFPRMYSLAEYGPPVIRLGDGGVGSLSLGDFPGPVESLAAVMARNLSGTFGPGVWPRPVLWHIPDVERVRELVEGSRRRSIAVGRRLGHPAPHDGG
jgi:hypothetical protein